MFFFCFFFHCLIPVLFIVFYFLLKYNQYKLSQTQPHNDASRSSPQNKMIKKRRLMVLFLPTFELNTKNNAHCYCNHVLYCLYMFCFVLSVFINNKSCFFQVELDSRFQNQTCGLCGDLSDIDAADDSVQSGKYLILHKTDIHKSFLEHVKFLAPQKTSSMLKFLLKVFKWRIHQETVNLSPPNPKFVQIKQVKFKLELKNLTYNTWLYNFID